MQDENLEVNADVVVEPVLCLHKKEEEATDEGTYQHQEATYIKKIQFQGDMDSYAGTLSALHATVMEKIPIHAQISNRKKLILQ